MPMNENKMFRRILGHMQDEIVEGQRKPHNTGFRNFSYIIRISSNKIRDTRDTYLLTYLLHGAEPLLNS